MDPNELRARFSGVIAFPITPFNSDLSLDSVGLRKNLEKVLDHPVCAVRPPLVDVSDEESKELHEILAGWKIFL